VIGWTAAAGRVETGALILAAVLFIWQIPHFLAIAWLYREDYERGGFRMLPVVDPDGRTTCRMVVVYCAALIPVTASASLLPSAGWLYLAGAVLLGGAFLLAGIRMLLDRSRGSARRLFLMSIAYLPFLFALLVLDPTGGTVLG
jgi:heme O synthase-like polyprenyltransferase